MAPETAVRNRAIGPFLEKSMGVDDIAKLMAFGWLLWILAPIGLILVFVFLFLTYMGLVWVWLTIVELWTKIQQHFCKHEDVSRISAYNPNIKCHKCGKIFDVEKS